MVSSTNLIYLLVYLSLSKTFLETININDPFQFGNYFGEDYLKLGG